MVFHLILVTAFLLYDLLFNVTCFFLNNGILLAFCCTCCHSCSIHSCYNGSYFRSLSNITRLPYSLYIPSSLSNSLLDNNIMYKSIEHYLNQTCFLTQKYRICFGKKSKISTLTSTCNLKLEFQLFTISSEELKLQILAA